MSRISHLLPVLALTCASCTTWQPTQEFEGWTLYVQSGETLEVDEFYSAVQPAFDAVERQLGPFDERVSVHAWNGGVDMSGGTRGVIHGDPDNFAVEIEGIGPARVRAFHSRSGGGLFGVSGVFVGTADTGTAVHELVHAHFAERKERLPLWFEEGFAMIMGDGAMRAGRWQHDGLACWPWRKLREEPLTDEDIAHLLRVTATANHSVKDNVLVHFLGWAIVFDLYREVGSLDWKLLLGRFREATDPLAEARRRLTRTLLEETPLDWLARLQNDDPAVRLAAARGTWKLHSSPALTMLTRALRHEEDPEVRAALAVNALATAGQRQLRRRQEGWMWRTVNPVLRDTVLESDEETKALRTLYRAYRYGSRRYDTQAALDRLNRFWEE
ncbi:MAG: HEAT repeat domain-containing protein [bacterium]|nr:HEAT repeat domain-containing protein [Planctomycetota bacterium]HIL52384.1 HEAT repeat domain-containing protein [Planctomycetota bacterium]